MGEEVGRWRLVPSDGTMAFLRVSRGHGRDYELDIDRVGFVLCGITPATALSVDCAVRANIGDQGRGWHTGPGQRQTWRWVEVVAFRMY